MTEQLDLIDRKVIIEEIKNAQSSLESNNDVIWEMNQKYFKGLAWAHRIILDAPKAEAKEVVHAKWQKQWCDNNMIGHEYEECPICGCMILDTEKFWDCKFCPNCGTDMT